MADRLRRRHGSSIFGSSNLPIGSINMFLKLKHATIAVLLELDTCHWAVG